MNRTSCREMRREHSTPSPNVNYGLPELFLRLSVMSMGSQVGRGEGGNWFVPILILSRVRNLTYVHPLGKPVVLL